jgi:hypothetical protein
MRRNAEPGPINFFIQLVALGLGRMEQWWKLGGHRWKLGGQRMAEWRRLAE